MDFYKEDTAEINLVARCTCGYVFDNLIYSSELKQCKNNYGATLCEFPKSKITPNICPNCHKRIDGIKSKYIDNNTNEFEVSFGYNGYDGY